MSVHEKRSLTATADGHDTSVLARPDGEQEYLAIADVIRKSKQFARLQSMHMMVPYIPGIEDKVRNRATHSEEVAQTAREISERLHLGASSAALSEAIALAHDIGHPPFSHEGEEAINRRIEPTGTPWDHDFEGVYTLIKRVDGLHEMPRFGDVLEGALKRHRRYPDNRDSYVRGGIYKKPQRLIPDGLIKAYGGIRFEEAAEAAMHRDSRTRADLGRFSHVEGQVAATADWVASTISDIEDMMTYHLAGKAPAEETKRFVDELCEFFAPARGLREEVNAIYFDALRARCLGRTPVTGLDAKDIVSAKTFQVKAFCQKLKTMLLDDIEVQAQRVTTTYADVLKSPADVTRLPELAVTPSAGMCRKLKHLNQFYQERVYPKFCIDHEDTALMVGTMFDDYYYGDMRLPGEWGKQFDEVCQQDSPTADDAMEQSQLRRKGMLVAEYLSQLHDDDVRAHIEKHHPQMAEAMRRDCEYARAAPQTETPEFRGTPLFSGKKVGLEEKLSALRDEHKLAMHVWESSNRYTFPEDTLREMKVPASHIRGRLSHTFQNPYDGMPLMSMTLLPSEKTGKSIRPWSTSHTMPRFGTGYLFNLDQDQYYPPRVLRVDSGNLGSGTNAVLKANGLYENSHIEELDKRAFYEPMADDLAAWKKRLATPQGRLLGEEQLGALGRYYEVKKRRQYHYDDARGILAHNEMLVAAAKTHIEAIMVPFFSGKNVPEWYQPLTKMAGALQGLRHIEYGLPLPVVYYHVSPEVKHEIPEAKRGGFSVIGKDANDFVRIIIESTQALQAHGLVSSDAFKSRSHDVRYDSLKNEVMETTGLDISKPLGEQHEAIMKLKAKFRCEGEGHDRSAA